MTSLSFPPEARSHERHVLALPRAPEVPAVSGFPVFATLAPVLASIALWVVTDSPFALAFAALGPLIAVASLGDSRLQAARTRRRERRRYLRDCDVAALEIEGYHERERNDRALGFQTAEALIGGEGRDASQWRRQSSGGVRVRLGLADIPSSLDVRGDRVGEPRLAERREALQTLAATLRGAPVGVDAASGVGFVGPAPIARAAARGVIIQIAACSPPGRWVLERGDQPYWDWLSALPHRVVRGAGELDGAVFRGPDGRRVVVAAADLVGGLPRETAAVVSVAAGAGRLLRHPEYSERPISLELVAEEAALDWATKERDAAAAARLLPEDSELPGVVELAPLLSRQHEDPALRGLRAAIGVGATANVTVDLVADGPHALVAGTTGSGKSELLISWVVSMADAHPPTSVSFLFVDFKGGAAFDPLRDLPHSVGVITDLDERQAARALASLRAELRSREASLQSSGLRSIDEGLESPFPRLVIVVDEYAALVERQPDLSAVFTDIAARGRSLGVHLILCTQRPSGVVRDGILANCDLRISLRVNNRSDSAAILGTSDAAELPPSQAGRALVSVRGESPVEFQVARATPEDAETAVARWASITERPRRPWCEPLPAVIPAESLGTLPLTGGFPFAVADRPEAQRQDAAFYDPGKHGSLLVLGAAGSGKTGVLAAIARAPGRSVARLVENDLALVWDALSSTSAGDERHPLLLLDDLDVLVASCPEEYLHPLLDRIGRCLREGPAHGLHLVLAAQRLTPALQSVAALCGSRLVLRMPSRQEHLLAGGESAEFDSALPPGGGHWLGHRVQVVVPPEVTGEPAPRRLPHSSDVGLDADSPLAVVSTRPLAFAERLATLTPRPITIVGNGSRAASGSADSGGPLEILVGDPDAWQAEWSRFASLRSSANLVFDSCTMADFRALTRLRKIPPPPARGERALWLLRPDGTVTRARLSGRHEHRPAVLP